MTRAQREALVGADPVTGLLGGAERVREALAARGLAVRHPRPPHRHYLTPAGRERSAALLAPGPEHEPEPEPSPEPPSPGVFAARTGDESDPPSPDRPRHVASAWQGLCELRRMTGRAPGLPCPWERAHLVPAAALALEAAGLPPSVRSPDGHPSAEGYRVTETAQSDAVRVGWEPTGSVAELRACEVALEGAGWHVTFHPAHPPGRPYVLASPRRL
nr:hypothetical protein [Streptomyces sp. SID5468]